MSQKLRQVLRLLLFTRGGRFLCFVLFFKISSQNQRFLNDCINSKQTKKPKTREVFSVDPVCGVLALRAGGRQGLWPWTGQRCVLMPTEHLPWNKLAFQVFQNGRKHPIMVITHPLPLWSPSGLRAGAAGPRGRHRAGPLKALAQAWPLCWVLQPLGRSGRRTPRGPLSLLSFPSLELRGSGCPVCEKPCRTIIELSKSSL